MGIAAGSLLSADIRVETPEGAKTKRRQGSGRLMVFYVNYQC